MTEFESLLGDITLTWIDRNFLFDVWIEALRRGPYVQGFSALLKHGHYCPLGVLCSVAEIPFEYPRGPHSAASFAGRRASLPMPLAEFMDVTEWVDFRNAIPATKSVVPRVEYPAGSIVSLNDNARWSFNEIARYLEDHRTNLREYPHDKKKR